MPRKIARSPYHTAVKTIIQERVITGDSTVKPDHQKKKTKKAKKTPADNDVLPRKKFHRATTATTLDLAPLFVYEELKPTAFQKDGKPIFSLSKCHFEGGLFKKRAPYIKACHLIRTSDAQLVNLSQSLNKRNETGVYRRNVQYAENSASTITTEPIRPGH
jgi:hypothetical protein